jgi:hypothetical protein
MLGPWDTSVDVTSRYAEDRWADRYGGKKPPVVKAIGTYGHFEPDCLCDPFEDMSIVTIIKTRSDMKSEESENSFVNLSNVADRLVAVVPTALLAGAYGACAFSAFALGPIWVGILIGSVPTFGLGVWASLSK